MMENTVGRSLYERQKPSYLNFILNVIIVLFFIVLMVELIFNSIYTNIYVKGSSMYPTLVGANNYSTTLESGGDYVFVNTHAKPHYSDIVVVETEDAFGNKYDIIKRVVALGGDTVKLDRGQLYVKYAGDEEFTKIIEDYVSSECNTPDYYKNTYNDHVVKEGYMFLLGDNRDVSEDSRAHGDYSLKSLVGVVPKWSLKHKSSITKIYTFLEFKLKINSFGGKIYGD